MSRFLIQLLDAGTNAQGMARRAIRVYETSNGTFALDRGTIYGDSNHLGQMFNKMRECGFIELPAVLTSNKELTSLKKLDNAIKLTDVDFDKCTMGHQVIARIGIAIDDNRKTKK